MRPKLQSIHAQRCRRGVADHQELAGLLNDITAKLELEGDSPGTNTMRSASEYGKRVKDHGETLSSLLAGFEYFTDAVYALIQNKLTTADMMNLISDLRRLNRNVSRLMEKSVEAYSKRKVA